MGALVAVETAARFPDKVRALGLCGVAAEMPVHPEMLESAKANTLKVQELMTFWGVGNALHKGGMVSPGLWLRRESLAVLSGNKPGVIHADLAACNAYKDALARAAAVKCPTVLVLGDGDLMTPAAKAKPLAAAIAGSTHRRDSQQRAFHDRRTARRNPRGVEVRCLIASLSSPARPRASAPPRTPSGARRLHGRAAFAQAVRRCRSGVWRPSCRAPATTRPTSPTSRRRAIWSPLSLSSTAGSTCWSTMPAKSIRIPHADLKAATPARLAAACSTST